MTAVGTEEATERDCLQLIDLCEWLTEGCAQSPRKIRGGGIPGREGGGESALALSASLLCSPTADSLSGLCEFTPRERKGERQAGREERIKRGRDGGREREGEGQTVGDRHKNRRTTN